MCCVHVDWTFIIGIYSMVKDWLDQVLNGVCTGGIMLIRLKQMISINYLSCAIMNSDHQRVSVM